MTDTDAGWPQQYHQLCLQYHEATSKLGRAQITLDIARQALRAIAKQHDDYATFSGTDCADIAHSALTLMDSLEELIV